MTWNWTEGGSRPHNLPIRQTGSPQKAVLLTRGLMGKLITPALHFLSSALPPPSFHPLLILRSCCCEVLSLAVRERESLAQTSLSPPSTTQGLEDQYGYSETLTDSPHLYRQIETEGKGKLITVSIKSFLVHLIGRHLRLASITSLKLRQTS